MCHVVSGRVSESQKKLWIKLWISILIFPFMV